ncbi:MAG: Fur family transcriptional regulator [Thermodesulfobacteriota bacterium]|jgi:Fur family ferric uptake transcriptional regulator
MKRGKISPALSKIRATIRAAGLRSTAPRVAVLQRLQEASTPVSHADIVEDLASKGFDRATLYRNLMDLTEVGLLSRIDVGDHVWRFELRRKERGRPQGHPHFTCTDCGDVACLPGVNVRISPTSGVPHAVAAKQVEIQFRGLCDRCAA